AGPAQGPLRLVAAGGEDGELVGAGGRDGGQQSGAAGAGLAVHDDGAAPAPRRGVAQLEERVELPRASAQDGRLGVRADGAAHGSHPGRTSLVSGPPRSYYVSS